MEQVHAFGSVIPNALKYLVPDSLLVQRNKYFKDRGYITNIALYLCGSDLEMIMVQLLIVPIIYKLCTKIRMKFLREFYKKVRFNMVIRTTIVMYVRIMMALMINIVNPTITTIIEILNFAATILLFVLFTITPALLSMLFDWKSEYISKSHCGTFNTLLPLRSKKITLLLNFYPIFLIKRLLFVATMVMLTNHIVY